MFYDISITDYPRYLCVAACGITAIFSKHSDLGIISVQTSPASITGVEKDTKATLTAVLTVSVMKEYWPLTAPSGD